MQASLERLRQRREEEEGGFTLIELLIVIVILAILAAIVVFAVDAMTGSSARASCESDVQTVDHAVQAYYGQVASYPTTISALQTSQLGSDGSTVGPWLHSTPTNGKHYKISVTDGTTSYTTAGDNITGNTTGTGISYLWSLTSGSPPTTSHVPPKGLVLVENYTNGAFTNSMLYQTPSSTADAGSLVATTPSLACAPAA